VPDAGVLSPDAAFDRQWALIDVRLYEVVLKALEQKPELRYQQASVLKTQVETIVSSTGDAPAEHSINPERLFGWLRHSLIPDATAALVAQLICFGLAWVVLVMGIRKLTTLELRSYELLFGVALISLKG